jgi:preprotein translocase subunit YajC
MQLLFPLLLVALLVPMFLSVRRQKREAGKTTSMQDSLKVGDLVTLTSGLYGTVVDMDETTVDIEIAEDVVTTWLRAAVREIRTDETQAGIEAEHEDVEPVDSEIVAEPHVASNGAEVNGSAVNGSAVEESIEDTDARIAKD